MTKKSKVRALEALIDFIRLGEKEGGEKSPSIDGFIEYLAANSDEARNFLVYLIGFISQYKSVDVYTHTGLLSGRGFFTLLKERVGDRFLPGVRDRKRLSHTLTSIFKSKEDIEFLDAINDDQWYKLFTALGSTEGLGEDCLAGLTIIQSDILHAVNLLSYEISGLSLDEEVIKAYPEIVELNSPFIAQNQEISEYVKAYKEYLFPDLDLGPTNKVTVPEEDHILVMLEQCLMLLKATHKNTYATGVSVRLTNVLVRLQQKVERLEQLLFLLHPDYEKKSEAFGELIFSITQGHRQSMRIYPLIRTNTELLSLRITETASKAGEAYVTEDLRGQWKMFLVSAGAGVLIAIMATIKILLGKLVLAPIGKALLNSFNYGFGFVFIYVCHFKIATKQPAMTASALASSIGQASRHKKAKMTELSELIVDILRTQIAAIAGNVALAMPVALLICIAWDKYLDKPLLSNTKAESLLNGIDPFASPSLLFAALTGVYLFFSGIISGYYDNQAIYRDLGRRVARYSLLLGLFGKFKARRIGTYVEKNFGSIAGNFWFGVMLGTTPTLGYILGLPLDIRHIAFSSANYIQGIFWLNDELSTSYLLYLFGGVLLIGAINLLVSFGLTLLVALRARKIEFSQWKDLFFLVISRVFRNPLVLFFPVGKEETNNVKTSQQ